MSKYLFLFTIGPVQSYISQARKTGDLYAGSRILSELTDFALSTLIDEWGLKRENIKFPNPDIKSKPNRFVVSIETDNMESLGTKLSEAVKKRFADIAEDMLKETISSVNFKNGPNKDFNKQIEDFLEIHWCALPIESDDYSQEYSQLESLMGSIKNVRAFPPSLEKPGRKCSICGERNALFYKGKGNTFRHNRYAIDLNENKNIRMNEGEGLCAVCFTKRQYQKDEPFPSTAGIALADVLQILQRDEDVKKLIDGYKKPFRNGTFDEQLFYEENLMKTYLDKNGYWDGLLRDCKNKTEKLKKVFDEYKELFETEKFEDQLYDEDNLKNDYLAKNGHWNYLKKKNMGKTDSEILSHLERARNKIDEEILSYLRGSRKIIEDKAKEKNLKLCKYYALVRADGDDMGKWLSGENLIHKKDLEYFHGKMSEKLGEFAGDMNKLFQNKKFGKLVYAGGDDLLAFLNLNHLSDVMIKINKDFPKFQEIRKEDGSELVKPGNRSTISAGVVIAHYKIPLSEVIKWSHKMEELAKQKPGKNSCAITVLKHAGEVRQTVFDWSFPVRGGDFKVFGLIKDLVNSCSSLFASDNILDYKNVLEGLRNPKCPYKLWIWDFMATKYKEKIRNYVPESSIDRSLEESVIAGFNDILNREDFYEHGIFDNLEIAEEAKLLLKMGQYRLEKTNIQRFNRLLFESIYPYEITKSLRDDFSARFIVNLDSEFRILMDENGRYIGHKQVISELKRLLARSYKKQGKDKTDKIKYLHDILSSFYRKLIRLDLFLDFLHIVRFINREVSYENQN